MVKRVIIFLMFTFLLTGLGAGITEQAYSLPLLAATDVVVYEDGLASGWQNWSWNTTVNFANASPARGSNSISVTYTSAWAGLSLRYDSPLNGADYSAISFWAHGGNTGSRTVNVFIQQTDTGSAGAMYSITIPAGTWTHFTIPLSDLGSPATIKRLNWQDATGGAQPTFYLDDIRLIANSGGGGTPPPSLTATITIQTNGSAISVSPYLRASNLPTWLGPTRFNNPVFRARTQASGLKLLRMPGGSWSNEYGWLSCELGQNDPGRLDCGNAWFWAAKPRDFIAFLKATGMEGMWTVSPNGTSLEAAALVAYFNGAVDDTRPIGVDVRGTDWKTVGYWAALRAQAGYPEPIGIKFWEVGNEVYGSKPETGGALCQSWGWENLWTCDGFEYVNGKGSGANRREGYLEFVNAMKAVDPTIQVGAVGYEWPGTPADGQSNWQTFAGWGSRVIQASGNNLDFYAVHPYAYFQPPNNPADILSNPQSHWPAFVNAIRNAFNTYGGGRQAPIAVTEFNLVSIQDQDNNQFMTRIVNALFLADSIGQAARLGIPILVQWDLVNGRAWNGTEYGLMHEDNGYYRAPQYYVYPLWARFGDQMIPVSSNLAEDTQLSVYAGRVDANTISLLAINKTASPIEATIVVDGFGTITSGNAWKVEGSSLLAQSVSYNGSSNPSDALSEPPETFSASGSTVTWTFPPFSIHLLHLSGSTGSDTIPPTVLSINRADPNPSSAASVNFTVTFSEAVTGVDAGDFSLTTTGTLSGAVVAGVSGSGNVYTVTVSTGTGRGTLRLDIPATADITDMDNNPLAGLPYTGGEAYIVRPLTATFYSIGTQDGWILESRENSNVGGSMDATGLLFNLGDDAGDRQYRAILSFNTAGLPDNATILGVTLKIKRRLVVGNDPFVTHGNIVVDIRQGSFGRPALQLGDFNAPASQSNVGQISGAMGAGGWYSAGLREEAFGFVNKVGVTQIRLRFLLDDDDDMRADVVRFFSGNAAKAYRPVLIVYYLP